MSMALRKQHSSGAIQRVRRARSRAMGTRIMPAATTTAAITADRMRSFRFISRLWTSVNLVAPSGPRGSHHGHVRPSLGSLCPTACHALTGWCRTFPLPDVRTICPVLQAAVLAAKDIDILVVVCALIRCAPDHYLAMLVHIAWGRCTFGFSHIILVEQCFYALPTRLCTVSPTAATLYPTAVPWDAGLAFRFSHLLRM